MIEKPNPLHRISPGLAWLLLLLSTVPFFIRPSGPSVWDANEAFYVETPREMVESGDWLLLRFNGQPRLNKPPLSYWLVAALYRWFGVSILWERLLMSFLAAGSVLLTFLIGRQLWREPGTALLAAIMFGTTFRLFLLARRLLIDLLLLFLILAALYFILGWLRSNRRAAALAASFFLGLGFLCKGPVAVLPLVVLVLYLALRRQLGRLLGWEWLLGGAVFLAVSASWFAALGLTHGWQPVRAFLLEENVGRFLNTDFGPKRGYLYYAGVFLADYFPWSILFPAAFAAVSRRCIRNRQDQQVNLFFLIWCAVYLLFFSFSFNKQEYYIAPVYAPASLLLAGWASGRVLPRILASLQAAGLMVAAALLTAAGMVLFPDAAFWCPPLCLLVGGWAAWRGRLLWQGLALSAFLATGAAIYLPALEEYRPVRPFAETMSAIAGENALQHWRAGYFLFTAPSLRFYLSRDIDELYDPQPALELMRGSDPAFLITDRTGYETLAGALGTGDLHVIETRPRLRTTGREFWKALRSGDSSGLKSDLYLISNRKLERSAR